MKQSVVFKWIFTGVESIFHSLVREFAMFSVVSDVLVKKSIKFSGAWDNLSPVWLIIKCFDIKSDKCIGLIKVMGRHKRANTIIHRSIMTFTFIFLEIIVLG